jgi:predicted transcriptional regulator
MLAYVKRTSVKLPDEMDLRLRHEASRRGTTIAEITREALEAHLGSSGQRRLIAAKSGRSGRSDTARRIEEIIRREARR